MSFNIFLAALPVAFGFVMLKNKSLTIRFASGFLWLIFLPNTLYLLTDFAHFFEDLPKLSGTFLWIDLSLYVILAVLGIITLVLSLYSYERIIFPNKSSGKMKRNIPAFFILNFVVGFGMVLGRVHRINSWEVFTDIKRVIVGSLVTISSFKLMLLALMFGILCQVLYAAFAKIILKTIRK